MTIRSNPYQAVEMPVDVPPRVAEHRVVFVEEGDRRTCEELTATARARLAR